MSRKRFIKFQIWVKSLQELRGNKLGLNFSQIEEQNFNKTK